MKLVVAITRGILRDMHARRMAMMAVTGGALAMLFAGSVFFTGWLGEHPGWFLLYWLACGWLTATALLLALFDLILVRREGRKREAALAREIFGEENGDGR